MIPDDDINIQEMIIRKKKFEKEKEDKQYERIYKTFLKEFSEIFKSNKHELFFQVPIFCYDCPLYQYSNCVNYILANLNKINTKKLFNFKTEKNVIYLYW